MCTNFSCYKVSWAVTLKIKYFIRCICKYIEELFALYVRAFFALKWEPIKRKQELTWADQGLFLRGAPLRNGVTDW